MNSNTVFVKTVSLLQIPQGVRAQMYDGSLCEFYAPINSWEWQDETLCEPEGIWVYCHQGKEGIQTWYAFSDYDEQELFLKFITVDGIGCATALKILSKNSWTTIWELIKQGDRRGFTTLPGVGPKTGGKIVDVLFKESPIQPKEVKVVPNQDAVMALEALGYKKTEATTKVLCAMGKLQGVDTDTSDLVREALKKMKLPGWEKAYVGTARRLDLAVPCYSWYRALRSLRGDPQAMEKMQELFLHNVYPSPLILMPVNQPYFWEQVRLGKIKVWDQLHQAILGTGRRQTGPEVAVYSKGQIMWLLSQLMEPSDNLGVEEFFESQLNVWQGPGTPWVLEV